jgi:hypothetical protein
MNTTARAMPCGGFIAGAVDIGSAVAPYGFILSASPPARSHAT